MAGFGLATTPLNSAAETFNGLVGTLSQVDLGGVGAFDTAAQELLASLSTSLSTAATTATATSSACEAQEGADAALQAADPTPAVIEQKKSEYLENPTPDKAEELKKLVQQRRDALDAHTAATSGTEFPSLDDLPDHEGTGSGSGSGSGEDGPIERGEDTDDDGTRGSDGSLPSDSDKPPVDGTDTPSNTAPQPSATSPAPAPSPTTTVSDTDTGTGLSGDTAVLDGPTSALASPTGQQMGGAQPQQGQGAVTAPMTGTMLNPNGAAPTRAQQRREQEERKENAARAAEAAAFTGAAVLPDSIANAQSTQVPGTPNSSMNLSSNDSRLGQMPPSVTQGHSTPPGAGAAGGPSQGTGMPLGSGVPGMARNNAMGGPSTPTPAPKSPVVEAPANPFAFLDDEPSHAEQYAPPPPPVPPPAPTEPTSTFDADEERRAAREMELKKRGFFDPR